MKRLLPLAIALSLLSALPRLDAQRRLFTTGTPSELALARSIGLDHLRAHAARRGLDQLGDVAATREHVDLQGMAHARVQQYFRGVPVLGGEAIAHIAPDGAVFAETDALVSGVLVNTTPRLTPDAAIAIAVADYGCSGCLTAAPVADLWVLRDGAQDHLVYRVRMTRLDGSDQTALPVRLVDAHGGYVVQAYDNLQTGTGSSLYSGIVSIGTSLRATPLPTQYVMENLTRRVGVRDWRNTTSLLSSVLDPDDFWDDLAHRAAVDAQFGAERFLDYLQSASTDATGSTVSAGRDHSPLMTA